jgi:hypothetical protein
MIQIRLWVRNFIHSQSLGTPLFLPVIIEVRGEMSIYGRGRRLPGSSNRVTLQWTVRIKYDNLWETRIK